MVCHFLDPVNQQGVRVRGSTKTRAVAAGGQTQSEWRRSRRITEIFRRDARRHMASSVAQVFACCGNLLAGAGEAIHAANFLHRQPKKRQIAGR